MTFTKPAANTLFTISSVPAWPSIVFQTDAQGDHTWKWSITWGTFSRAGLAKTAGNTWDAGPAITDAGGTLTVVASAGAASATIAVLVKGTNPTAAEVIQYVHTRPNSDGFERIVRHETKSRHFNSANEPIKSFDGGYGLCQLTTPKPTFEQAWNWKLNIDGGLALFGQKRASATNYLGQSGRKFTPEQLKFETVCRWNGGSYHKWDAGAGAWTRASTMLCDTKTGNIGWDMTDAENKGKTEAVLHARDQASYSRPPGPGAHWQYSGVCYADRVCLSALAVVGGCVGEPTQTTPREAPAQTAPRGDAGHAVPRSEAGQPAPRGEPASVTASSVNNQTRFEIRIGPDRDALDVPVDSTVRPGTAPRAVDIIGELSGRAIVLVDRYPSSPGGLSYCQAGEESFLRVVSLAAAQPSETIAVKLASCRQNLELADPGVEWQPDPPTVRIHWLSGASGSPEERTIELGPDGTVLPVKPVSR